jgi:hemerythrin-like domain-containing protein
MLRNEHEIILQALDTTEEIARQVAGGKAVAADTLAGILEFLRLFADRMHHGKEEDLLFPMLETKGLPRQGGPVAVMLHEHDLGRALIRNMVEASEQFSAGAADAAARWAEAAREYAALLRAHIQKENDILFRIAEQVLSPAEQAQLAQAFGKSEVQKLTPGTRERLQDFMQKLNASALS